MTDETNGDVMTLEQVRDSLRNRAKVMRESENYLEGITDRMADWFDVRADALDAHLAAMRVDDAGDVEDMVSKALRRAWQLGQTYWQQADSDSWSQNKKADETQAKFATLVDEMRAAIQAALAKE